jgi:Flp pilus assembly protein TadG
MGFHIRMPHATTVVRTPGTVPGSRMIEDASACGPSASRRTARMRWRFGTATRRRPAKDGGQAMIEFALLAPLGFLLLLSIVVVGIMATNYVQLTNEARDGARIVAICGSNSGAVLPDGTGRLCDGAFTNYITSRLVALPAGSVSPVISVTSGLTTCTIVDAQGNVNQACNCSPGAIVQVTMSYNQPLYFPLLSNVLASNSNGTILLSASAQATCEQ